MKCNIQECHGEYEERMIVHTAIYESERFSIDNVPAKVCNICGDTLLNPETVRQIEIITGINIGERQFERGQFMTLSKFVANHTEL